MAVSMGLSFLSASGVADAGAGAGAGVGAGVAGAAAGAAVEDAAGEGPPLWAVRPLPRLPPALALASRAADMVKKQLSANTR